MIKAVIFDFDDTLVNTFETKCKAIQQTAREIYQIELLEEIIKTHWGKPYEEMMQNIFHQIPDNSKTVITHYEKIRENFPAELFRGVEKTLTKLNKYLLLGVLTSTSKPLIQKDLALIGLNPSIFFFIQTAENTTVHKPNGEVFQPILEELKKREITPDEIVYIGDSLNDYFAAKDAGIKFYGVTTGNTSASEFEKYSVPLLKKLSDLITLIPQI